MVGAIVGLVSGQWFWGLGLKPATDTSESRRPILVRRKVLFETLKRLAVKNLVEKRTEADWDEHRKAFIDAKATLRFWCT